MSTPAFRTELYAVLAALDDLEDIGSGETPRTGDMPFGRIYWDQNEAPALSGDARSLWGRNEFQVSVWEAAATEDGSLATAVRDALDGEKFDGHRVVFRSATRIEEEGDVVQTALTFSHRTPFHT